MLTSNYYKILRCMYERDWMFTATSYGGSEKSDYGMNTSNNSSNGIYQVNDVAGTTIADQSGGAKTTNTVAVVCGSGSTAPAAGDHVLANDNTASFTTVSTTCSIGITDGNITRTYTRTLKNDTAADLTIAEVGVVKAVSSGYSVYQYYLLIERTVLENPVTVAAGKTVTVQIAITEDNDSVAVS